MNNIRMLLLLVSKFALRGYYHTFTLMYVIILQYFLFIFV